MRAGLWGVVAALAWAAPVAAQDWVVQDGPGGPLATTCAPGGGGGAVTAFCLSLGCPGGGAPAAVLSVTEGSPGSAVRATATVDGAVAGALDFRRAPDEATWVAPVGEEDAIVAALRGGGSAAVRLDWKGGGVERALGLGGSDAAIGAALGACAAERLPADTLLADTVPRSSADPAGEAVARNAAFCGTGAAAVEPGFVRLADLDGDGVNDLVLDYLGLTCDGARAFCGTGGCSVEIWRGDREGPWRLLLEAQVEAVARPAPGLVELRLDGGACGLAGAEACVRRFRAGPGGLVAQP